MVKSRIPIPIFLLSFGASSLVAFLCSFNCLWGQRTQWVNADSLNVTYGRVSEKIVGQDSLGNWLIEPVKYIVIIEMSDSRKKEIRLWTKRDWVKNLKSKSSDFGTNLILYWLSRNDATTLKEWAPNAWRKHEKAHEVRFWRKYLRNNQLQIR